jgi:hypothetical protein
MKRLVIFLLLVVFGTALAAFLLRPKPPAEPLARLAAIIAAAPADAFAVFYLDAESIRSSAIVQRITRTLPLAKEEKDYADFVHGTGFDYSRDLDRAVIALRSAKGQPSLAWVEGRFDQQKIEGYAKSRGGFVALPVSTAGKPPVFLLRDKDSSEASAFSFLNEKRLAWAHSQTGLDPAALTFTSAGPLPPEMQERLQRIAGAALFGVARLDPADADTRQRAGDNWLAGQLAGIAGSVRWASFAVRPEEGRMKVQVAGECDGAWNATQLGLVMDGLHLMARQSLQDPNSRRQMSAQQYALLEHLVQNATIARDSNIVYLRFELTEAVLAEAGSAKGAR